MSRRMNFGRYDVAAFGAFIAYAASALVIPVVLVPMARDLGFPLEDGGMALGGSLHTMRSVTLILSMMAGGFVAGRWGVRRPLGVALALMCAGITTAALSPTFGMVLVAVAVAGAGEGILEALATPAVQKLHPDEPGRYINFTHAFWSVGVLVSVLAIGALLSAQVPWRWIVAGAGAVALVPSLLFLLPGRTPTDALEAGVGLAPRTILAQSVDILKHPRFWLFFAAMFFAGAGEFGLTYWAASFIRIEFGGGAWAGGVGTACFAAGMMAGRLAWGYLIAEHRLSHLVLGSAVAAAAVCLPVPSLHSLPLLFAVLFLAGIACGPFWPSIQSYGVNELPVDATMLLILLSCAGIPGCGLATWALGAVGDAHGLRISFYMLPACFLVVAALIGTDRAMHGPAGRTAGERR